MSSAVRGLSSRPLLALVLAGSLAACGGDSPSAPAVPAKITLSQTSIELAALGDSVAVTASVVDEAGAPMPEVPVEWRSSNDRIASVSSTGVIVSTGNGSARIMALAGGVTAEVNVRIQQVAVGLEFSLDTIRINALTATQPLGARLVDAKGSEVSGADLDVGIGNPSVVGYADGVLTAKAVGTSEVFARSGNFADTARVEVRQVPARVRIDQRTHSLAGPGASVQISAEVTDSANIAMEAGTLQWSSTRSDVATVSSGLVTARGEGLAYVVASAGALADSAFIRVGDPIRIVLREEVVHEFVDSRRAPPYEYAGQQYPGGLVSYFPQGFEIFDLWQDGSPDLFVPLMVGYASGIDTRIEPLLFRSEGGRLVNATDEVNLPAIAGVRRVGRIEAQGDAIRGLFTIQHDTGDGRQADGLLLEAGAVPVNGTDRLGRFPLADAYGRPTAVNSHSLGTGDLNGDGRTDFVVGDWGDASKCATCKPFFLIQTAAGTWTVQQSDFLVDIVNNQPMVEAGAGEGHNLLIDFHLADVNGDGQADLIAGYGHGSTYSQLFYNQGNGTFSRSASVPLPAPPFGISNSLHLKTYSLDLNRDQALDLVVVYSRYQPYYGGYALQILINDGQGSFRDETFSRLRSIAANENANARLNWTDNFTFVDVNGDGALDLIGGPGGSVRLWLNGGSGHFNEVPVENQELLQDGAMPLGWADFGNGRIGSLAFRMSWTDAEGTAVRVWFTQYELQGGGVP